MSKEDEKEKLYRESKTTQDDKITTTIRQPEQTTSVSQTIGGFYNTDGTPNEAAQADFEAQRRAAAAAYGIDPNTGRVDKRYVTDILGVDPEKMRKQREQEERDNKSKATAANLLNALLVFNDIGTIAGGGNVWKRDAINIGKEAVDANKVLKREQEAEDIANAAKLRGNEQSYAAAVQKIHDAVGKAYSTKVTNTNKEGGNSISTTTGGGSHTTGWIEKSKGTSGSGDGDGGGKGSVSIGVLDSNGNLSTQSVTKDQAANLVEHAKAIYTQAFNNGDERMLQNFVAKGIVRAKEEADGTMSYIWNDEALQRSGYLFWGGGNPNVDASIKDYYRRITGYKGTITPQTGGDHGRLSVQKNARASR